MFNNEDVTIGSWMLALNVWHEDNRAICDSRCTSTSIAVWDIPKCSGTKSLLIYQQNLIGNYTKLTYKSWIFIITVSAQSIYLSSSKEFWSLKNIVLFSSSYLVHWAWF